MTGNDLLVPAGVPAVHGALDDFDFLIGDWNVRMRRRRTILANDDEWYDLAATCSTRKLVAGYANLDDIRMEAPTGPVSAITLRLFDPTTRQWTIYWVASKKMVLDPGVVGGFENGDGIFYGPDTHDGKPVLARFTWRKGTTPHWEQAFSADGGATWETNWTADFDRA